MNEPYKQMLKIVSNVKFVIASLSIHNMLPFPCYFLKFDNFLFVKAKIHAMENLENYKSKEKN